MRLLSRLLPIVLSMAILSGCKKKNLDDYKGDPGTAGTDARHVEQIVTVNSSDWTLTGKQYKATLFIDKITQAVYESGSVLVYSNKNNQWRQLPFPEEDTYMLYSFTTGQLFLHYADTHSALPPAVPVTQTFKVIIYTN